MRLVSCACSLIIAWQFVRSRAAKMICSYSTATVVLGLIVSFAYTAAVNNGGVLGFVDLSQLSSSHVNTVPVNSYGYLHLNDGLKMGDFDVYNIYVSTNGYISMEDTPQYDTLPNFPVADTDVIVAPFADHINTALTGSVLYTDFLESYDYYSQFNDITNFIQSHTGDDFFYGDRMMVAEWKNVPLYGASASDVNRFQVVLIESTAGDTYAVFIYDCGTMMWGGGVIGWQASSSDYMANDRSGQTDNNDIACSYSRRQSAIVYRLSSCTYDEFSCGNRQCVDEYDKCDGIDDCGDNSDEQGCVTENIGAVVGGSTAAFFIVIFLAVIFSIACSVRFARRRRFARVNACIIATTGPSVTVATVSNISSSQGAPLLANEQQPPTNVYPTSYPQPQQGCQVLVNPVTGHSPSSQPHPPPPPPYSAQPQTQLYSAYPPANQAGPPRY